MDCVTRVSGLAVATTLCVGGTGLLIWWVVDLARERGKGGALAVLCVVLVFWVGVSACVYPAFCAAFFPWHALGRRLDPLRRRYLGRLHGDAGAWRRRIRGDDGGGVAAGALPRFVARTQGRLMDALHREPPVVRGRVRVADASDVAAYEKRDAALADGVCAVCLDEVETGQMVKRLPLCQHPFHEQCVDRWLSERLTCPICRCDVFAPLPAQMVQ